MHLKLAKTLFLLSCATLAADEPAMNSDQSTRQTPVPTEFTHTDSGRPHVKHGINLFVTGDYLCWHATEQKLIFAGNIETSDTLGLNAAKGKAVSAKFKWRSGFRVGLGYNIGHDQWDTRLIWTSFKDRAQGHLSGSAEKLVFGSVSSPLFGITCFSAHTHLDLHSNLLDWELGREFFTGKWLTLRPFAGLRGGWIDQKWKTEFDNSVTSANLGTLDSFDVLLKQKFWGFGVRAGLDTNWKLIRGFSLYADGAFSLLYSLFRDGRKESAILGGVETVVLNGNESTRCEQTILELQLGLRWDQMFAHDRCHFRLQAGWEHTVFLDHNRFFYFSEGTVESLMEYGGNLAFQGLTVSARLDF